MALNFPGIAGNYAYRESVNFGLNGATEFSWACWLKSDLSQVDGRLFEKNIHVTGWRTFHVYFYQNKFGFGIENLSLGQYFDYRADDAIVSTDWTFASGSWLKGALDETDCSLYVNGALVAATFDDDDTLTGSFVMEEDATKKFLMGVRYDETVALKGGLAHIILLKKHLTANEHMALYNNPASCRNYPYPTELLEWFDLEIAV